MHRIYRYEVWYRNGEYKLDYVTGAGLLFKENEWAYTATRYRVQLTDWEQLPPF